MQQIKDKLNIIDVVAPYVELKKSSKNFVGRCPFHAEKTPSFNVSPERGMYHCYGCGVGGDIFNFVQEIEGVDFKEALKILAHKAGVELVPENPAKKSEREHLYAVLEAATTFYSDWLEKKTDAKEYLVNRGVKPETIAKWRIGYAPGPSAHGWREAKDYLESAGYKHDELLKAGLIKKTDSGKEPFDVFRDRIMFPMAEPNAKIVAFSGRILSKDSEAPKYVNSPETELYKKSELLYGYDKAKAGIRNLNFSLIVEGQFDVVMCHQAGYHNTVAVSGTALTLHHVQLLERLSDKVVLALDADKAGINAMKKGATLMLGRGLDVKIAELPVGKDPADLIQSNPIDFKHVIGKSVHVIEFLLHVLRREIRDDRSFKLKAREEVLPFILLLPSRIDQEHFVDKVAEAIHTTADAVRFELDRLREKMNQSNGRAEIYSEQALASQMKDSQKGASDSSDRTYLFLVAAVKVLDKLHAEIVEREIELIKTIGDLKVVEDNEIAGLVFTLEDHFARLPKLALEEEIVAKLNQLKVGLIRRKLTANRLQLLEAESSGDEKAFAAALNLVRAQEIKLKEPAYTAELFTVKKD